MEVLQEMEHLLSDSYKGKALYPSRGQPVISLLLGDHSNKK